MNQNHRSLPRNEEAELGVLGSIMLLPGVIEEVASVVCPKDFYDPANRKVYEYLLKLYEDGRAIDSTLLVERLKDSGELELVGGMAHLGNIVDSVVNAAHAKHYAHIVREKAQARELIEALTSGLEDAYQGGEKAHDQIKSIDRRLQEIAERGRSIELITAREAVTQAIDHINEAMTKKTDGRRIGIWELDRVLGGLHGGELTILAARPSNGKSSLAQQIAEHVATSETVLYYTLEMAPRDLAMRNMAAHAQVPFNELRIGATTPEQRLRALAAGDQFGALPIVFRDATRATTREVRSAIKQLIRENRAPGLVIVDYLGLLSPEEARSPRHEAVGTMARQLKEIARETKCPVLCLCQLNRESESKGRKPRVSDLRESGDIEAHADTVVLLHREDMANPDDPDVKNKAVAIVGKNRNGACGEVPLHFDGSRTRFTAIEARSEFQW